ncbi:MAG: glycosyltransferase [bacterium]|nr:glycosyltransferase [bacterium]
MTKWIQKATGQSLFEKEGIVLAGILDELSEVSFSNACTFINLHAMYWREQLETVSPLFLFVESAWRGRENSWYQKISPVQKELRELVSWCRKRKIPTVFWNKEDPVQFFHFFSAAALFDWVFTTELDCVPLYRELLGHCQIGYLPFAADVSQYNPIVSGKRKQAVCFAGAYYVRQKERCRDFQQMYEACTAYLPFDIYARITNRGNPDYTYPIQYKENIKGTIPVNKMSKVYKSYQYAATLNTVKKSRTMFARRAVEIGASNTLLLSNYCKGLVTLFGDLVIYYKEEEEFSKLLSALRNKEHYYRKVRLAFYRKIMLEHTYKQRIIYLCRRVLGKEIRQQVSSVLVYSIIQTKEQEENIRKQFARQTYHKKELLLLCNSEGISKDITSYVTADYYCCFGSNNYYGSNFITDCMLALNYVDANIIGKGKYITYQNGIYIENSCEEYQYGQPIYYDRCIVSFQAAGQKKKCFLESTFSIDCLNFCEGCSEDRCEQVEDLAINCGTSISDLYAFEEKERKHMPLDCQKRILPEEFMASLCCLDETLQIRKKENHSIEINAGTRKLDRLYVDSALRFMTEEYAKEGSIDIFIVAEKKGDAALLVRSCNEEKQILQTQNLKLNGVTRMVIQKEANEFYFSMKLGSHAKIQLRDIVINLNIR